MTKLSKKILIGLGIGGVILAGGITADQLNVSQSEFDQMIPTIAQAKDAKGNSYGKVVKDISSKGLSQKEALFVQAILDGKGPTAEGTDSVNDIQQLYFDTAVKMGLTKEQILKGGVNLYEFIRK